MFSLESPTRTNELAGIDGPFVGRLVPIAEGARIERERHVPGFAGSETDFGEAFQFALGAVDLRRGVGDVELGNFRSGHVAGVGHVESDRYRRIQSAAVAGAARFEKLKVV